VTVLDDAEDVDVAALERAVASVLGSDDQGRREQVQDMLREREWYEVARFCACLCQMQVLRLRPWEIEPGSLTEAQVGRIIATGEPHDDLHGRYKAAVIGQRLLDSGRSLFEVDPSALEVASGVSPEKE